MSRRTLAAATVVGLFALGACARGDNSAYDAGTGMTSGAMATPPAIIDSFTADSIRRDSIQRDSIRRDSVRRDTSTKRPY